MTGTGAVLYSFSATIIALLSTSLAVHYRKQRDNSRKVNDLWGHEFSLLKGSSHNFLDACRLIAIHRNGRLNVFTFARGDTNFTIETMGLLSDTPQTWREQAGLK